MFKCASCNRLTDPREKGTMRIIKTRIKTYYDLRGQYAGEGEEIVQEIRICRFCASAEATEYPKAVEKFQETQENT